MMRRWRLSALPVLVVLSMLAGCGGSSSANGGGNSSSKGGCVAEVREINGVNTRSFCGAASAEATVNGQSWTWSNGECFKTSGMVGVNIGRVILDTGAAADQLKKQYDYFGVTVQASADGTTTGAVTYVYHGTSDSVISASITLSGNLTKGSFTGTSLLSGATLSGNWSC